MVRGMAFIVGLDFSSSGMIGHLYHGFTMKTRIILIRRKAINPLMMS